MSQQAIEVILARQLADYLALPVFLVDPDGGLIFYNEPAEKILGHRYENTGPMPAAEWATIFKPTDEDGNELAPDQLPLIVALRDKRPAHSGFWIRGLDGVLRPGGVAHGARAGNGCEHGFEPRAQQRRVFHQEHVHRSLWSSA